MGMSSPTTASSGGASDDRKGEALAPSDDYKQNYVGVTHRRRRGKFQARIYKMNKEYNIGLFDLATDAAFAYDMAYRLFGVKLIRKQGPPPGLTPDTTKSDPFESEEANFVFNWLSYPDEAMLDVETPERMNFTCPSDYREKRSKELALRLLASSQDPKDDEGSKDMGSTLSEADVVAKVRKEIVSIAKLAAVICPDQKLFGKRASELMFDELPEVEVRSRKRSKKSSREGVGQHKFQQHQQMLSGTTSNIPFEQLLQRQMFGQTMMGSHFGNGYGGMFGSMPSMQMSSMAPPAPSTSHNHLLGHSTNQANTMTMPTTTMPMSMPSEVALPVSSSMGLNSSGLPPTGPGGSSTIDSQLLSYLMMQQSMPQNHMLSINDQLNRPRQINMSPQSNMASINEQFLNNGHHQGVAGQKAEQMLLLPTKVPQLPQPENEAKDV